MGTFDITFQHQTTFSFKTRNRLKNFAKLPKYHISKILPYTVYRQYLLIKAATLLFFTECSETQVATLSMIN